MNDRVDMLGGVVAISSHPGGSTTIRGVIPLGSAAELARATAS
jgi:signal transduction histidine kinase